MTPSTPSDAGTDSGVMMTAPPPPDGGLVATADAHLTQKGRIGREEWIEQAKELMAGKPPRAKTDRART